MPPLELNVSAPMPATVIPVQLVLPVIAPPNVIVPPVMPLMLTTRCGLLCDIVPL